MKRFPLLLLALLAMTAGSAHLPEDFVWETMSHDSSGSMPVGGGDVGLNVWAEDGNLLFYISHNGAFDEHGTLLKQGRVRLSIPGDTLAPFTQRLRLSEGWCEVAINGSRVSVWADVNKPVVHVEIESPSPILPEISYESWRYTDRPFRKGEGRQNAWKWASPKGKVTTRDSISVSDGGLTFFHHNPSLTIFDKTVQAEGLDSLKNQIGDPLACLVSGGILLGNNLRFDGTEDGVYAGTDYRAWKFGASKSSRKHHYTILLHNAQTADTKEWVSGIDSLKSKINLVRDRKDTQEWWKRFWERSYIAPPTDADTTVTRMVRNLELFRYMLGCNAHGEYPTKFNGGLFTFDPIFVDSAQTFTPDYRNWGGTTMTAQNQRLVYWPMLKSGDADMMHSQLDLYLRMLPTAELRTRAYWGHGGGCFGEQIEIFGLPNLMEYGTKRPTYSDPGVEYNAWLEYEWDTVLEFCQMALEAERYAGLEMTRYRPLIESALTFFDEHYRLLASRRGSKELDGDGKLVLYPGSGCETYKMAANAASAVAALRRVASSYAE
ncbi:MAG: hypothetical protein K2H87_08175, partial [Duncaniella sp.]|nr:hypothetical protein [Duncaniella sp.]